MYDRQFLLDQKTTSSLDVVYAATLDTLHSLGLIRRPDPVARQTAESPTCSGRLWRRRKRVRQTLRKVNIRKAACPDNIPAVYLKDVQVLTDILNTSLDQAIVSPCFKSETIIPVPKKPTITSLNDYRPVALTLIIMKCFERLVKSHITNRLPPLFRPVPVGLPFQFVYRSNRSTEDVISSVVHLSLSHLEEKNTYVRMLFVDFSLAFNTILPQHLASKLGPLSFGTPVCNWLLDFLTDRPQQVRAGKNTSNFISLSTAVHPDDPGLSGQIQYQLHPKVCG